MKRMLTYISPFTILSDPFNKAIREGQIKRSTFKEFQNYLKFSGALAIAFNGSIITGPTVTSYKSPASHCRPVSKEVDIGLPNRVIVSCCGNGFHGVCAAPPFATRIIFFRRSGKKRRFEFFQERYSKDKGG